MEKFRNWYLTNFPAINWFIIGSLTTFGFVALTQGNYVNALIDFVLAYLNFLFRARI
jgi:hypothetical protein